MGVRNTPPEVTQEDILDAVTRALGVFLDHTNWQEAFGILLSAALKYTDSEYGFVGVIVDTPSQSPPTLRVLSHEGIVWDAEVNNKFYQQAVATYQTQGYLEFTNFNNLFGVAITSGKVVIANDPANDQRSGGRPAGHPPMHNFLGVPIMKGGQVVGEIALANKKDGYSEDDRLAIELLIREVGVLCSSYRRAEREEELEKEGKSARRLNTLVIVFLLASVLSALVGSVVALIFS